MHYCVLDCPRRDPRQPDLGPAVQTAELAFGGRGILIRLDARLREGDYGERNGMPVTRLAAERSWHIDQPWPGGQSHRQVVAQVGSFLQDLSAGWEGRAVVVIGHSATKWALDCLPDGATLENLVDAPFGWQEGWHYRLPPTGGARATAEPAQAHPDDDRRPAVVAVAGLGSSAHDDRVRCAGGLGRLEAGQRRCGWTAAGECTR
jgi:hypothetical protein